MKPQMKPQMKPDTGIPSESSRLWKEKPPGAEQRELERMFNSNEISASDTADNVRKSNEIFTHFTPSVFSAHFRKTKAKLGLNVSAASVDDLLTIPELAGGNVVQDGDAQPSPQLPLHEDKRIEFRNAPFVTWTYTNHEKQCDFVCLLLPILSGGTRNLSFTISGNGMQVIVKYTWPSAVYKAEEIFRDDIEKKLLTLEHPKVHAFVSSLLALNITEKTNPQAQIIVDLPRKVMRENTSWEKRTFSINETKIVLLQFVAYQSDLIIHDADTSLIFE